MRGLPVILILLLKAVPVWAVPAQTEQPLFEISENACEKLTGDESKSSARIRASDKAAFNGVEKLEPVKLIATILDEHEINVFIYRLVDEYIEDMSAETTEDNSGRVCVKVHGWLNPENITLVKQEFVQDDKPVSEPAEETVVKVAEETKQIFASAPKNPDDLALLHIKKLQYYNGAETSKFIPDLKKKFSGNTWFYLTDEEELADYVLTPKVLKAKVDALDAGHKRLQTVVLIEINGTNGEPISEYQNRFVLFGAEEDEQQVAARLIAKLLDNAGDGALRKVERMEQLKQERKIIGQATGKQE